VPEGMAELLLHFVFMLDTIGKDGLLHRSRHHIYLISKILSIKF
jgi:hypothetical protein